jgi:hypothetical protein
MTWVEHHVSICNKNLKEYVVGATTSLFVETREREKATYKAPWFCAPCKLVGLFFFLFFFGSNKGKEKRNRKKLNVIQKEIRTRTVGNESKNDPNLSKDRTRRFTMAKWLGKEPQAIKATTTIKWLVQGKYCQ